MYHIPGRREDFSGSFAVRTHWVTEDLKNTHKSAVQGDMNTDNFSCYEMQCVMLQCVFEGYRSHLTTRIHNGIITPLLSSYVCKTQGTRIEDTKRKMTEAVCTATIPFLPLANEVQA